jgi:Rrf2 family protein
MRLQQATRCALFAVFELAGDPERQISAAEIAEKYGLSVNHLAKVLRALTRAGLIDATRGAGGGYRFRGNAKRVTLHDVIEIFEDIAPPPSARPEAGGESDIGRALARVLAEIDDTSVATLKSITLTTFLKLVVRQD